MSKQYCVTGMTCAACQAHVEKAVSKVKNVDNVSVSLLTNSMIVEGKADPSEIINAVESAGYGARLANGHDSEREKSGYAEDEILKDRETPKLKKRLKYSMVFLILLMYITMGHNMLGFPVPKALEHNHIGLAVVQMLIAIVILIINRAFFISGFKSIRHLSPNMDTLVAMGSSVSFGWSLYVLMKMTVIVADGGTNAGLMDMYHDELYFEASAMIPALITVGKTLESISKGKTTDALKKLIRMTPKTAVIERDGNEAEISVEDVNPGDIFIVRSGEAIPVDGVVTEGSCSVDESALTGESVPVDKSVDDHLSAATINLAGYIKARAVKVGEDTVFSQIIKLVTEASATKAPIARIADKIAGIFVPAVISIALVVFAGWMIAGKEVFFSLERAIAVLVVSCPCALGLATPVAIMVGNGIGARNGILFKTSEAVETAGRIGIVALDKTGTITEGRPMVTDIIPADGINEEEIVAAAYSLEKKSEHPLARAITMYAEEHGVPEKKVVDFAVLSGNGIRGTIDNRIFYGGSLKYLGTVVPVDQVMKREAEKLADQGKTPLFFGYDDKMLGIIAVADVIKESSAKAIAELRAQGIETIMLTGDNEKTARAIGAKAGVDKVIAGVLPEGKEEVIRKLQSKCKVAMVGDGINDAPALTRADIGIAIGAGTDIAMDSADIVLMNSKLTDVSGAIRLSRATLRNVHQNLFWAFAYNTILIPMAAGLYPGLEMNPMWGAAAMAVSSFTVCMNALRLNLFKVYDASHDKPIKIKRKHDDIKSAVIYVGGMMCNMCEKHVKEALESLDFIEEASADHTTGEVKVIYKHSLDEEQIRKTIEKEDYEFLKLTLDDNNVRI